MSDIDLLLEKWLTGYKKYGKLIDVFQDPQRKELAEFSGKWRFIADAQKKTVYVWDAMTAIHADTWGVIKKEIDPTIPMLYKHPALLPGTVDDEVVTIYAAEYMSQGIRKGIQQQDWSFLEKYFTQKGKGFFEDAIHRL